MARLCKCYGEDCIQQGLKYPKDELVSVGGKNYCKKCHDKKIEEDKQRTLLYKFIKESYNISFPTAFMLKQIKDFKEKEGISYKMQRFTLKYVRDILGMEMNPKYGVSIVSYRYHEMLEYCEELEKKKKASDELEEGKVEVIRKKRNRRRYKSDRIIDLTSINLEEEV